MRFPAKWKPVRVKKTRQIKNPEPRSDSIGTDKALARDPLAPAVHGGPHAADGLAETHEQRLPHHEVADVELGEFRQRRDRLGRLVVEAVAGMNLEPRGTRELRALDDALPFRLGPGGMTIDHG